MDYKQLVGANWVDPPERKRKRANYAENAFYASSKLSGKDRKDLKLPKMPQLQDFQFFDTHRLQELYEKMHAYEVRRGAARGQTECAGGSAGVAQLQDLQLFDTHRLQELYEKTPA